MKPEQKHAYVLADNKLALNAGLDGELLAEKPQAHSGLDDLGFDFGEIHTRITGLDVEKPGNPEDDVLPARTPHRVHPGNLWQLGSHRLICGDSLDRNVVGALMQGDAARTVFSDTP